MSDTVETLRKAAEKLRTEAEAARAERPGQWVAARVPVNDLHFGMVPSTTLTATNGDEVRNLFAVGSLPMAVAEYMGTVGPDVGLALADWLDHEAAIREHNLKKWTIFTRNWVVQSHFADPVARAVLGDS